MTEHTSSPAGPDLTQGVPSADVTANSIVTGHVDGEPALVVHQAGELHAIRLAVATVARDLDSLRAEAAFEQEAADTGSHP